MSSHDHTSANSSRRSFVKRALYVTPAVLTLRANPAFAAYGSGRPQEQTDSSANGFISLFRAWLE